MTLLADLSKALAPKTSIFSSRRTKDEAVATQVAETLQAYGDRVTTLPDAEREALLHIAGQILSPPGAAQAALTSPNALTATCATAAQKLIPPDTKALYQNILAAHRQAKTPQPAGFQTLVAAAKAPAFALPKNLTSGTYSEKQKLSGKARALFDKICNDAAAKDPHIAEHLKSPKLQGTAALHIAGFAPIYMTKAVFAGGFGEVRFGLLNNRLVAVKVLVIEPGSRASRTMVTPEDEALKELEYLQLLGANTQPLVATLVKGKHDRHRLFIVMAYQQGELNTLFDALPTNKLKRSAALHALVSLAEQGQKMAGAKLMHGDIKPANILYDHRGSVGLSDMGLVRKLDSGMMRHLSNGGLAGTPEFLPHEVHQPSFNGMLVDMWAVGATLWSCIVGHSPLSGCPEGQDRFNYAGKMADAFNHWQGSQTGMSTAARRSEAEQRTASSAPQMFRSLYRGYLQLIEVLGEPLANLIAFKLMHRKPDDRGSWREVEKLGRGLLKESHEKTAQGELFQTIRGAAAKKNARDRAINLVLQAHQAAAEGTALK